MDLVEKDLPAPHRWRRQLPWTAQQLHDAALGEALRADVFDVVIAFGALGFSLLRGLLQGGTVQARCVWTDFTHIDTMMMLPLARQPWRANQLLEIGRVWGIEKAATQASTVTTACTSSDQDRIRRWFRLSDVRLLENPIFDPQVPSGPLLIPRSPGDDVLLTGDLAHDANVEGIRWFLERCLPMLRDDGVRNRITLAGRSPDRSIRQACRSHDDVTIIADPSNEEMERIWSEGIVSLVPLQRASGSRIRILDSVRRGIPVISTSKGAEGLAHAEAPLIHIADSPLDFAHELANALSRPPSESEQTSTSTWLTKHHSLAAFTSTVEGILSSVAG